MHEWGLVVGKFAPLHKGHEALITWAQARCQRVLLLSYASPEPSGCPAPLREHWLRTLFPAARTEVLDEARLQERCAARGTALRPLLADTAPGPQHWDWLAWCLVDVLGARVDAMLGSEPYVAPCAAHLSHVMGGAVAAEVFDLARQRHPISATAIRADPIAMRDWLPPVVAASWVSAAPSAPTAPAAPR